MHVLCLYGYQRSGNKAAIIKGSRKKNRKENNLIDLFCQKHYIHKILKMEQVCN